MDSSQYSLLLTFMLLMLTYFSVRFSSALLTLYIKQLASTMFQKQGFITLRLSLEVLGIINCMYRRVNARDVVTACIYQVSNFILQST
jgi:hypothetical protein